MLYELRFLCSSVTKYPNAVIVQHDTIFRTRTEGHGCSEAVEALPAAQCGHTSQIWQNTEVYNQPFIDKPFG